MSYKNYAHVRIGAPAEFFSCRALETLYKTDGYYEVTFGLTRELLEQLQDRKLDCVIATKKYGIPGIQYTAWESETLVIVGASHMKVSPDVCEQTWLEQQHWISYGRELPIMRRIWKQHFHTHAVMEAAHIIPDLRGILKAVELGMGISVLPTYIAKEWIEAGRCQILFPHLSFTNALYFAYREEDSDVFAIESIKKSIAKLS
ncbi:substrate-binding domain-containing protein [Ectobacillus sp. JY-23]|uniref:substrate-binding domain-containing protein n=1 Tax=Ectobacillus sp. JY-23 TaxID=2933872 RepID=UPI001FF37D7F|nr:substrate-binding domain-containing protein [Ectobacillus sp. JY-23]UOY91874.1 substrate-binding domain-containing protein [Ectobacillus sp. JY-23]